MSSHIAFGNASVVPAQITHAVWKRGATDPNAYTIEVFTTAGQSVSLAADHDDAEAAAKAVGLNKQYDEWAEPIKAKVKAAEDAAKAEAKAEAAEHKAAHAHK